MLILFYFSPHISAQGIEKVGEQEEHLESEAREKESLSEEPLDSQSEEESPSGAASSQSSENKVEKLPEQNKNERPTADNATEESNDQKESNLNGDKAEKDSSQVASPKVENKDDQRNISAASTEENTLKNGVYDDRVIELKNKLGELGFLSFTHPTRYFGFQTEQGVKDFQSYYGVEVTGVADVATLQRIEEALATPFQIGKNDSETILVKEHLATLGYLDFNDPTTYYGPITANAVKEFQSDNGLVISGIADLNTRAKLESLATAPLSKGMYRSDAILLKKNIDKLGFASFNKPNNYFGPKTEQGVKAFQSYYGLKPTGIADSETLAKIEEMVLSPFQSGKRNEKTIQLKENLAILGYLSFDNPTTYYGPVTSNAVKEFQAEHGLVVSGIAEPITRTKLQELATMPLSKGMYRSDAIDLKKNLTKLGFANFKNPNEYFGPVTEQAVKDFQSYYGLNVTGVAGDETLKKIEQIISSPFQSGRSDKQTVHLKENLAILGFLSFDNPTPYYGPITAKAVKQFQSDYGLAISGIADPITSDKLKQLASAPLSIGMYREDAIELKKNLDQLGFLSFSNPNNYFGPITEKALKDFQKYYGLSVDGVAGEATLSKMQGVITSPFQNGKRDKRTIQLKEDLTKLGFLEFDNPTTYYGSVTEEAVKDLQSYYNLRVNGIADEITLSKIKDVLNSPFQNGKRHEDVVGIKEKLNNLGLTSFKNPNDYFGPETEQGIKEFQKIYGLPISGIAEEVTLEKLDGAKKSTNFTKYDVTLSEAAKIQMKAAPQTDANYAYVSSNYINDQKEVTANLLNVRSGASASNRVVGSLKQGTRVTIISEVNGWYQIEYKGAGWVDAAYEDVLYYLDPTNFLNDKKKRFQFLDLSRSSDASVSLLNEYLKGKGILQGKGQAFLDASAIHGVSDIYLLSHALLETGNGTSSLSLGVDVGINEKGNPVLVTSSNKNKLTDIKTTYNMYGIGAVDHNAYEGGAITAYNRKWFSPELAIVGGAEFIGNNYVKAGQNTLYKMRWNPASMSNNGVASHQYATDIGWASKQIYTMYNLYQDLGITKVYLDVPEYK